jgi:hypothetical protein
MSTGANSSDTKDLPKGREAGVEKTTGPMIIGPAHSSGIASSLFVALLFVEPIFRAREILWPVIQVEITTPGTIRLIFVVRACPWEVSACVPWLAVLLAHRVLHCGLAPHHAAPSHEMPGGAPGFQPFKASMASRGPSHRAKLQPTDQYGFWAEISRWARSPEMMHQNHFAGSCRKAS